MQKDRMRCILSGMKRYELTLAETEFIAFAEQNLNKNGPLMKFIELILERIYGQKTEFIRNSILSALKKEENPLQPASAGTKTSLGRF